MRGNALFAQLASSAPVPLWLQFLVTLRKSTKIWRDRLHANLAPKTMSALSSTVYQKLAQVVIMLMQAPESAASRDKYALVLHKAAPKANSLLIASVSPVQLATDALGPAVTLSCAVVAPLNNSLMRGNHSAPLAQQGLSALQYMIGLSSVHLASIQDREMDTAVSAR